MKHLRNQSGMIDIILIVVVLVAAIGVGGYVYNQQQQTKKAENAASNGVIVAKRNDNSLITSRVQSFYDSYAGKDLGGKDPKLTLEQLRIKGYITAAAITKLNAVVGGDAVLCTQGGSGEPIKIGTPTITGSTARVTVSQNYTGTGTNVPNYMYVQLTKSGSWVISAISCSSS